MFIFMDEYHLDLGVEKLEDISNDTIKSITESLIAFFFLGISEDGKKISRVSDLENLEEHDKVNNARLPHHVANKMMFYGTALIELSNEEEVANIFNQNMVYEEVRLELKPKKDFDVKRDNEEKEVEKNHPRSGPNSKNNSKPELDYPKDLIIAFKLKRISTESSTE
ncbi:putative myb-related protein 3R-1-like [Capsicum annuum]|uniref:Uncharacterized protein n=1 Tax=Capsicum annuum TaxID=4072 RepID=A0A2G2Z8D2_CAPAN|nr:putative myb-related protein 3R-1-like [Capsicum annuum]KAF3662909.1 putative myb-related protein 3R-1-like [Capsicum annuum]PHT78229.1 hypothetical protein T459_16281 [Capsicum annuum]